MSLRDVSDNDLVERVHMGAETQFQAPFLLEMQRRVIDALRASGDCASQQTAEVINLTRALKTLTWVLVGVGVVQIVLMVWKG